MAFISPVTSTVKPLSKKAAHEAERQEALDRLHEILKPGDTVYTVLRHVSKSGMLRRIDLYKFENNRPVYLTHFASKAIGAKIGKEDGLVMGGCGMDMGFEAVYQLSRAMWPNGYDCNGDHCWSNDHVNGDPDYTPHLHRDGGYALMQRWL